MVSSHTVRLSLLRLPLPGSSMASLAQELPLQLPLTSQTSAVNGRH